MKKVISMLICLVLLLGTVPVFAHNLPYSVVSEFNDGEMIGKVVKANENFNADFVLIAALCKDGSVLKVKTMEKSKLASEREISFDYVEGAEIKLFAWDSVGSLKPAEEDYLSGLTYDGVMALLKKANDYWISENSQINIDSNPWQVAVYHTGNMQAYYMTGDELYRKYSTLWSEINNFDFYSFYGNDNTNADNICCYQTYIDLYNIDKDESYLENVEKSLDIIINSASNSYWDWIDAFYMAAPVFTKMYEITGEEKYLDKMYKMIRYNAETLNCYDEEVGLWYRDAGYIYQRSENGAKVFWSRGDGWVYAALARIIEEIPDSYEHKDYFVNIFLEMSKALKEVQCENGAWHESLLDKNYNPDCEESGTGFFVYGMLWGINNGYLEEGEYLDCALQGWRWLSETAMDETGHIGFVQPIGPQPTKVQLTKDMTENYAYANFIFAASELCKYLGGVQGDVLPYLNKKLLGNIEVYKMDSPYYIRKGEIEEFTHPMIIEEDGDIKIVKDNMYVLLDEYLKDGMFWYEKDGVYIMSEFITPFNKSEENLIDVLSGILDTGKFPQRQYSDPDRIEISEKKYTDDNIEVSQWPQDHNAPANMADGNFNTYWAARVEDEENPAWAVIDLGEINYIYQIGIAFNKGFDRESIFSVSVSSDNVNYKEVLPKTNSSGKTNYVEYYEFDLTEARYVKLYGYGNTDEGVKAWFSPTEVIIYSAFGDLIFGTPGNSSIINLTADMVSASSIPEDFNRPEHMVDGDFDTRWAVDYRTGEEPPYATIDLKKVYNLDKIGIAFTKGDIRAYTFEVKVSEDGINYTTVIGKRQSVQGTLGTVQYGFEPAYARYVRLYGYGNTTNNWFNPTEIEIYKVTE